MPWQVLRRSLSCCFGATDSAKAALLGGFIVRFPSLRTSFAAGSFCRNFCSRLSTFCWVSCSFFFLSASFSFLPTTFNHVVVSSEGLGEEVASSFALSAGWLMLSLADRAFLFSFLLWGALLHFLRHLPWVHPGALRFAGLAVSLLGCIATPSLLKRLPVSLMPEFPSSHFGALPPLGLVVGSPLLSRLDPVASAVSGVFPSVSAAVSPQPLLVVVPCSVLVQLEPSFPQLG